MNSEVLFEIIMKIDSKSRSRLFSNFEILFEEHLNNKNTLAIDYCFFDNSYYDIVAKKEVHKLKYYLLKEAVLPNEHISLIINEILFELELFAGKESYVHHHSSDYDNQILLNPTINKRYERLDVYKKIMVLKLITGRDVISNECDRLVFTSLSMEMIDYLNNFEFDNNVLKLRKLT